MPSSPEGQHAFWPLSVAQSRDTCLHFAGGYPEREKRTWDTLNRAVSGGFDRAVEIAMIEPLFHEGGPQRRCSGGGAGGLGWGRTS